MEQEKDFCRDARLNFKIKPLEFSHVPLYYYKYRKHAKGKGWNIATACGDIDQGF